ncbi:hypothetical protein EJB05_56077 [Eragrostis curvula]|uniref:Uncharacterized protein n=1 Tax=Eragrostis curvula TaxID=38414 RepID=A0A5J9SIB3_9POAL|nr:hypothetical protein EJB05_56077 [Eragrostis curvula]
MELFKEFHSSQITGSVSQTVQKALRREIDALHKQAQDARDSNRTRDAQDLRKESARKATLTSSLSSKFKGEGQMSCISGSSMYPCWLWKPSQVCSRSLSFPSKEALLVERPLDRIKSGALPSEEYPEVASGTCPRLHSEGEECSRGDRHRAKGPGQDSGGSDPTWTKVYLRVGPLCLPTIEG